MSRTRWLRIVLVLLMAATLPGLTVALAQEAAAGPPSLAPEVEPNDTPWEANSINGWRQGRINPVGDLDYYRLYSNYPGLDLFVELRLPPGSLLVPVVSFLDADENVLAGATCGGVLACLSLRLPEGDDFYVRVADGNGAGGPAYQYEVRVRYADPNEPNNFLSQATPYTLGEPLPALIEPEGDVDTYVFTAEAGRQFFIGYIGMDMILLDADGQPGRGDPDVATRRGGEGPAWQRSAAPGDEPEDRFCARVLRLHDRVRRDRDLLSANGGRQFQLLWPQLLYPASEVC